MKFLESLLSFIKRRQKRASISPEPQSASLQLSNKHSEGKIALAIKRLSSNTRTFLPSHVPCGSAALTSASVSNMVDLQKHSPHLPGLLPELLEQIFLEVLNATYTSHRAKTIKTLSLVHRTWLAVARRLSLVVICIDGIKQADTIPAYIIHLHQTGDLARLAPTRTLISRTWRDMLPDRFPEFFPLIQETLTGLCLHGSREKRYLEGVQVSLPNLKQLEIWRMHGGDVMALLDAAGPSIESLTIYQAGIAVGQEDPTNPRHAPFPKLRTLTLGHASIYFIRYFLSRAPRLDVLSIDIWKHHISEIAKVLRNDCPPTIKELKCSVKCDKYDDVDTADVAEIDQVIQLRGWKRNLSAHSSVAGWDI